MPVFQDFGDFMKEHRLAPAPPGFMADPNAKPIEKGWCLLFIGAQITLPSSALGQHPQTFCWGGGHVCVCVCVCVCVLVLDLNERVEEREREHAHTGVKIGK